MPWPLAFEKTKSRCDWRGHWAWLLSYKIRLQSFTYFRVLPDDIYRCAWTYLHITHQQSWSVSWGLWKEEAMILKLLLFCSLLILASSQEDDDAGKETAECDSVSQPTSLLVDSKSGNRAMSSALPKRPTIPTEYCTFRPYSCRLRRYPECCRNPQCKRTSARRRYCCPFPPYSCKKQNGLRNHPECCKNSACVNTSARRRYCWQKYLSGNNLSEKAR